MIVWQDEKGRIVDATGSINYAELERLKAEHGEVERDKAKGAITPVGQAPFQNIDEQLKERGLPPQQSLEDVFAEARAKVPPAQDPLAGQPQDELSEVDTSAAAEQGSAVEQGDDSPEQAEPEPEAPSTHDLKEVWVDYAVSQGLARDEAESYTKQELIDEYGV